MRNLIILVFVSLALRLYLSSDGLFWFWDTYAFWRTNYYKNYEVKIREIHPKWNFVNGYRDWELSEKHKKVIHHYTIPGRVQDEGLINDPNISNTIGDFDVLR